ncbi:MAG: HD domain-containing protein [bacterium]|nr:HD domain-containing protein [bacterium]
MQEQDISPVVDFLFEVGSLAATPRSGFHLLGSGQQTVAEHTNRVVFIGYTLATLSEGVDVAKVMKMALFHDLPEGRTSDLNYVHQKYAQVNDTQAMQDLVSKLPFKDEMEQLYHEYEARETIEAQLAKDADQLEWIMSLKEQADIGNTRANTFLPPAVKRLKTPIAQQLATRIILTGSDEWWYADKKDEWWVSRNAVVPGNVAMAGTGTIETVLQVGVKMAIQNKRGEYLLVKRNLVKYPEVKDPWDIIGGRIENGHPLMENLAREIKEETGLDLVDVPQLIAAQDILRVPGRHVVRLTYTGQAVGELKLDPNEHVEYRWFRPDELNQLEGFDEYAKEILKKSA